MARLNQHIGQRLLRSCLGLSCLVMTTLATGQSLQAESSIDAGPSDRLVFTGAFRYTPPAAPDTDQIKQRIIAGPFATLQLAKDEDFKADHLLKPIAYVEPDAVEATNPFKFFALPAGLANAPNPLMGQPSIGHIVEDDSSIVDEIREARLTIGTTEEAESLPQLPAAHPNRHRRSVTAASTKKRTKRVHRRKRVARWTKRLRKRRTVRTIAVASTVYANANRWTRSAFSARN